MSEARSCCRFPSLGLPLLGAWAGAVALHACASRSFSYAFGNRMYLNVWYWAGPDDEALEILAFLAPLAGGMLGWLLQRAADQLMFRMSARRVALRLAQPPNRGRGACWIIFLVIPGILIGSYFPDYRVSSGTHTHYEKDGEHIAYHCKHRLILWSERVYEDYEESPVPVSTWARQMQGESFARNTRIYLATFGAFLGLALGLTILDFRWRLRLRRALKAQSFPTA